MNLRSLINFWLVACIITSAAASANLCEVVSQEDPARDGTPLAALLKTREVLSPMIRTGASGVEEFKAAWAVLESLHTEIRDLEPTLIRKTITAGKENEGIYFIVDQGIPKVIKIIQMPLPVLHTVVLPLSMGKPIPALPEDFRKQTITMVRDFFRELTNAELGFAAGAPQLYGAGMIRTATGPRFYLELEDMSYGVRSFTSKDSDATAAEIWLDLHQRNQPLGKKLAGLLESAFRQRFLADDPDFLVDSGLHFRWIDTGKWMHVSDVDELITKFAPKAVGTMLVFGNTGMTHVPETIRRQITADLLREFFARIPHLNLSPAQEKKFLLAFQQSDDFPLLYHAAGYWDASKGPVPFSEVWRFYQRSVRPD